MNWTKYELEKAKIQNKNLSKDEYENQIEELVSALEREESAGVQRQLFNTGKYNSEWDDYR